MINKQCDIREGHTAHVWQRDGNEYVQCTGIPFPSQETVLDGRQAYGDRVQNMREQADLFNAYLSGRTIQAHDVPILYVLTKLHRMGKMPDYADNYDDAEGYLTIAREVIGDDMIEAKTAKEYAEIKAEREQPNNPGVDAAIQSIFAMRHADRDELDAQEDMKEAMRLQHANDQEPDAWSPNGKPLPGSHYPIKHCRFGHDHPGHVYHDEPEGPNYWCTGMRRRNLADVNTRERGE